MLGRSSESQENGHCVSGQMAVCFRRRDTVFQEKEHCVSEKGALFLRKRGSLS